ncbi:hypothetical protein TWF970_001243 [Orbilia oligospora]|uniref:C2H2-type domain-containing protein n=1 Tax=Orbilia oligospora TaxID=2813651 RepID=A0A7C8VRA3_ORBOL|nr:hypothetical protein TWF970_001243 [Orbilia oligospora]
MHRKGTGAPAGGADPKIGGGDTLPIELGVSVPEREPSQPAELPVGASSSSTATKSLKRRSNEVASPAFGGGSFSPSGLLLPFLPREVKKQKVGQDYGNTVDLEVVLEMDMGGPEDELTVQCGEITPKVPSQHLHPRAVPANRARCHKPSGIDYDDREAKPSGTRGPETMELVFGPNLPEECDQSLERAQEIGSSKLPRELSSTDPHKATRAARSDSIGTLSDSNDKDEEYADYGDSPEYNPDSHSDPEDDDYWPTSPLPTKSIDGQARNKKQGKKRPLEPRQPWQPQDPQEPHEMQEPHEPQELQELQELPQPKKKLFICEFPGCGTICGTLRGFAQHQLFNHTGRVDFAYQCLFPGCLFSYANKGANIARWTVRQHQMKEHSEWFKEVSSDQDELYYYISDNETRLPPRLVAALSQDQVQPPKQKPKAVCDYPGCGKEYTRQFTLRNHKEKAHGTTPVAEARCLFPGCGKRFEDPMDSVAKRNLSVHQKWNHAEWFDETEDTDRYHIEEKANPTPKKREPTAGIFKCDFEGCNKSYSRKFQLHEHKMVKHTTGTPYVFTCLYPGCSKEARHPVRWGARKVAYVHAKGVHYDWWKWKPESEWYKITKEGDP